MLAHLKKESLAHDHKYRGAPKDGHRGENIKIVAQQKDGISVKSKISWQNKKMASCCNHKYREATKEGHRGTNINIVAQQRRLGANINIVKRQKMASW